MKRLGVWLMVTSLLLAGCAGAKDVVGGLLVLAGETALEPGQTIMGDVAVTNGDLVVPAGSEITGSLVVLGGSVTLGGRVGGSATSFLGTLTVLPEARIGGDLVRSGGSVIGIETAQVAGQVRDLTGGQRSAGSGAEAEPLARRLIAGLAQAVVAALLAALAVRLVPVPIGRVRSAASSYGLISAAMGALFLCTALTLVVMMAFTLVLIPLVAGSLVLLAITVAYGWAATGWALGSWLVARAGRQVGPARCAFFGTAGLMLVLSSLSWLTELPVLGGIGQGLELLLVIGISLVGSGAVILTTYGWRTFVPAYEREALPGMSADQPG